MSGMKAKGNFQHLAEVTVIGKPKNEYHYSYPVDYLRCCLVIIQLFSGGQDKILSQRKRIVLPL